MTIGWSQDTTLMQFGANTITLNGNGGPGPATSNKTLLTVNGVGFGHKSYQGGNTPIWLSQSNQGEFYIALGNGTPVAFSDMKNGHPVAISKDAGNRITYGSDGAIFVAPGAMADADRIATLEATVAKLMARIKALSRRRNGEGLKWRSATPFGARHPLWRRCDHRSRRRAKAGTLDLDAARHAVPPTDHASGQQRARFRRHQLRDRKHRHG